MALDLDLAQIRDTTRWFDKRAAEFLPPHLSSCATGGAFATGPATFDVSHPKTALSFGTACGFTATVPGIDEASEAALNQRYLDLGATPGIRFAVFDAVNLAARVGQPVLVARLLSSRPWH